MRFVREAPRLMLAPAVIGAMALLLYLLGQVPAYLRSLSDNEYESLEAAESAAGFEIVLPVYFPSYLAWPPARIRVQASPVAITQTVFRSSVTGDETLILYQAAATGESPPTPLPWVDTLLDTSRVPLNDGEAELVTGRRADGETVSAVRWETKGFRFVLVTTQPVREALMMARSMHPRGP